MSFTTLGAAMKAPRWPVLALALALATAPAAAQSVSVGAGSYTTALPSGGSTPSDDLGNPILPVRTADITGPVPTTDWWTPIVFKFRADNPYSDVLAAHPLNLKARAGGLGIGTGRKVPALSYYYAYHYQEDFVVGTVGMAAAATTLAGYGDWTVTAQWDSGSDQLQATMGHGLPFVYFTRSGGPMQLKFGAIPAVWSNQDGVLGITVNNKHYGIFAPGGSTWTIAGTTFQSDLGGQDYMSLACLPDNTPATLALFRDHAYAFVTGTRVSWDYDEAAATVTTTYEVETEVKEGAAATPLLALYRHQWLHTAAGFLDFSYDSLRGQMKVIAADGFSTTMTYPGIMPILPGAVSDSPGYDSDLMDGFLDDFLDRTYGQLFYRGDTYFGGKDLGLVAAAIRVADQVGRADVRDYLLTALRTRLENWLTASAGETQDLFYYNNTWGTLYGYPASFSTDRELNDHHFHWGYFVMAAATVACYDAAWAQDDHWGGMINLLIRDAAAWDRDDPMFPFLRCFDIYAGHSWASGHGAFGDGNNQESSSESMQFAAATALWGSLTGNTAIRDLGAYLYTTEMHAVEQYWFDVDDIVFPPEYDHNCVGMVWGTKGTHETWFSAEPEMIHGINYLPITPASLYLGRRPEYVAANHAEVVAENGGEPDDWVDLMWEYLALADPEAALDGFDAAPGYAPESGESPAHTYYWLHSLAAYGQLDPTVTADTPHYAAFRTDAGVNYVYYNAGTEATTIHFSDGHAVVAPPRQAGIDRQVDGVSGVGPRELPSSPVLLGAYPNPFNPRTVIAFDVPRETVVSLSIYDVAGRMVAELIHGEAVQPGRHEVRWGGRDRDGHTAPAGVYFCRLEAGGQVRTGSVTLLK